MKISEFKELLSLYPDDVEILLAKDGEGNGFSPLASEAIGIIDLEDNKEHPWHIEYVYDPELSADDHCLEEWYWNSLVENGTRVLVLWPAN